MWMCSKGGHYRGFFVYSDFGGSGSSLFQHKLSPGHAHCRTRQSGRSASAFQRGHSHAGESRAGSGNGTRSEHSPEEGGHRGGPSSRQRVWVPQPYFIVPGKGVASYFRSNWTAQSYDWSLGCSLRAGRVSDQIRGLVVTSDLEDAYSFPITGSFRGVLWGQSVSISGSSIWPCTLTPISSSEWMAVRHRDVILAHFKELGLRLNIRKVCFSSTENHLSGRSVGSGHDAGTYIPCSDRVNPHVSQESKRRLVTHCQAVSKTAGSDVRCVQCDTFWSAIRETPTVVAQGPPEGKPTSHDQGHAAMLTCLRHVEEILGFCLRAWCWELLVAA